MLTELRIQNFAIIDKLELKFGPGLIILTGETGAGKSIILDAVTMLIGGRAETTVIRSEAEHAFVEGLFSLKGPEKEALHEILKREELLDDEKLRHADARSPPRGAQHRTRQWPDRERVPAQGTGCAAGGYPRPIGTSLPARYARTPGPAGPLRGRGSALSEYRQSYHKLLAVRRELKELRQAQADAERRIDFLTYQAEEIEAARLKPGEEEELKQERDRLANAESLAEFAQEALTALDEGTPESPAASDLVGQAAQAMMGLAKIDPEHAELSEQATGLDADAGRAGPQPA